MREDICTIPISEVFEPRDGCPICRMRNTLENRVTEYITGAAMMEPDVRIVTNRMGFCYDHFAMMLHKGSRLSNALILESHLKEIGKQIMRLEDKKSIPGKKELAMADELAHSCFVCERIEWAMTRMFDTIYRLWQSEEEFRTLYAQQPYLCIPHYVQLMKGAGKGVPRKQQDAFVRATAEIAGRYLKELQADVTHFCSMFDYRNNGGDWGNSKDSIERAICYLTSREVGWNERIEDVKQ